MCSNTWLRNTTSKLNGASSAMLAVAVSPWELQAASARLPTSYPTASQLSWIAARSRNPPPQPKSRNRLLWYGPYRATQSRRNVAEMGLLEAVWRLPLVPPRVENLAKIRIVLESLAILERVHVANRS